MKTPGSLLSLATVSLCALTSLATAKTDTPNILWITSEDNSIHWLGSYGNPHADTPNLDQLATEGFRYTNCFANAPVCAPSRCTWITGINAVSMGTHPMRSRYEIPHDLIKYYPDYLKEAGYFVSNHTKTDYNIGGRDDKEPWDSKERFAWKDRPEGKPFFCIVNHTESHESKAFGDVTDTEHSPDDVKVAAYHPDIEPMRQNYAHYHDAVKRMDAKVGEVLAELEKDGLAEDTIVIYNSDHGGVLPRSKRFLFESGIHCPLIVRIPEKYKHLWPADQPGETVDRIVSFVDMPKTWLSLTGSKVPEIMQGRIFLGEDTEPGQEYHFAFRGRMDERYDNVRAVRGPRFLYIRNYMPFAPWGQHLNYLWKMVATQAWEEEYKAGNTDAVTSRFFKAKPYTEELYDTQSDPDNVNNLAGNAEYQMVMEPMRAALREWQEEIYDSGILPEAERVRRAQDKGVTLFEYVRNPEWYPLATYLDAADVALAKDPANLDTLVEFLDDEDSGVRYWGAVGCLLLGDDAKSAKNALHTRLDDDSHDTRIIAAWTLINLGEQEKGRAVLADLLEKKTYASLAALNVIDWLGEDGEPLAEAVNNFKPGAGIQPGFSSNIQSYLREKFGLTPPADPEANRKAKRKANKKK
ncbi:MAG: sulfatase-like hydrolase/transferase [Verrucomicrobiota bacterium]